MIPTLAAATPDLALGLTFLIVWLAPFPLPRDIVAGFTMVMLLEFIIIHSSAFMGVTLFKPGPRKKKLLAMLGLGAFYTLFVGGFALAFHTAWPVVSFWLLTLNRMAGVILGTAPTGEARAYVQRSWAAGAVFYLMGAFVTTLLPIPRLGLHGAAMANQELMGSGLWVSEPHRVIAFGFLYFTAVGLSELRGHEWARKGAEGAARENERRAA